MNSVMDILTQNPFAAAAADDGVTVKPTSWRVVSAADLCATPPPTPDELIKGLLYKGGTMMLNGPSKSRKTYTMLAAGQAIASGSPWLQFETTKTPVLYLNLELQDFATQDRLSDICRAMGVPPSPNLHVANLRGELVTLDKLKTNLPRLLDQTGAGLVMVDPHYKITSASGVEENSNDGQAKFLYAIENLCALSGAGLMLAHHFAKGDASQKRAMDRSAGGGVLARWPDVVMTLTDHQQEECMSAEFVLRNFAPVPPFVVRWEHPVWVMAEELNPSQLRKGGGRKVEYPSSDLLGVLTDGMTNSEWRNAIGWTDGTFRRGRDELIGAHKVRCNSGCFYHGTPKSPESPKSILAA